MSHSDPELLVLEAAERGLPYIVEDDAVVSRAFLIELIETRLLTGEVIPCDIGPSVMNVHLTIAGKKRLDELRQIAKSKTLEFPCPVDRVMTTMGLWHTGYHHHHRSLSQISSAGAVKTPSR